MVFFALGWAFRIHSWLTIGYAIILFAFFDIKARREERWLMEKFPGYPAYRRACAN
jgi:protein-S-isoprenylcysteine O-methyltransferase Ste14